MTSEQSSDAPADVCPECGGQVHFDYNAEETVCTKCGIVVPGSPSGVIREEESKLEATKKKARSKLVRSRGPPVKLSGETKKFLHKLPPRTCPRCHRVFSPKAHNQKLCPDCQSNKESRKHRDYQRKYMRCVRDEDGIRKIREGIANLQLREAELIAKREKDQESLRRVKATQYFLTMKYVSALKARQDRANRLERTILELRKLRRERATRKRELAALIRRTKRTRTLSKRDRKSSSR